MNLRQYKIGTKQYFAENSKDGTVFVSSLENMRSFFTGDKWQYGGKGEVLDQTGNLMYTLSQSEKASYDFDQYWEKLNAQLKMDQYNQFADVVKRYERIKKNNGRDYTLYCRWLFCEKLPASDFFSGRKATLENKKEITFPEQKITRYNTVNFWQQEYDYQNQDTHNDILGDAIAIFRSKGTSYYDMGLWDELLSDDKTYFYQVIAGNNPSFWTESNFKTAAGKVNDVASFFINEYISNALLALANSQNITPERTDRHLEKLTNASGVQKNLAQGGHVNAKTRTITFRINANKVSSLSNNKNISISAQSTISGTKQTSITLTLFCDDEGFKNIEDYIKRTNQGNRAANDANKLSAVIDGNVSVKAGAGVNNPNLISEEFKITLPEERFKQLEAQLKKTHGSNFTGFEQIENKDGLISAKFKGRGTAESIEELKAYLQKYASGNTESRFATVKTLLTKITTNHIDITINAKNLSDASQEMSNVIRESAPSTVTDHLPHQNGTPPPTNNSGKLKGANAATNASMLFELLLLVWQAKLLRDNTQKLDELNLKPEERQELLYGVVFASVSVAINSIKTFTTSVKKLADMAGSVESKAMVLVTNKATALSEKALMRVLIGSAGKIDYIAKAWGTLEGLKDGFYGYTKLKRGFIRSGIWQMLSGASLALSMWTGKSKIGIVLSVILILFSVFCSYMSESTMLTVMEQWFDRCYFGKNELTDNLSRYPLTEEGLKKLIYGFYGASRGYALFLTKKSQNSFIIDYGSRYDIYLNLILPAYNPQSINYYGSLIVEKTEGGKKILIGHTLSQNTLSTTTLRDDISETLTPLEMKVDFTMQNASTADTQQQFVSSEQTYLLNEQGALIVCQKLYIADDNIDKKISILGYIDEQDSDDSSFVIELADYIDI